MKYVGFNLNHNIKVRLNEDGKTILRTSYSRHMDQVDEDGFHTFQAHTFMHLFGSYLAVGRTSPLSNMNALIQVEDDQ